MTLETGSNFIQNFDVAKSRDCTLLIEWSKETISYSIYLQQNNRVLHTEVCDEYFSLFDATAQDFTRLLTTTKLSGLSFAKTVVIVNTAYFTLVPEIFYDSDKNEEILAMNTQLPSSQLVHNASSILSTPYQYLYSIPLDLKKALDESFANYEIGSAQANILNFLIKQNKQEQYLHLHCTEETITLIYLHEQELKYCNQYSYNSGEDMLYNILNVYQQLGLDTEKCPLHISGSLASESDTYQLLKEYIRFSHFATRPIKINYEPALIDTPEHYFLAHYIHFL